MINDYRPAIPALSLHALDHIGRNVYVFRYPYFFRKPLFADTDRYTVARNHHTFWWFVTDFELDFSGVWYRLTINIFWYATIDFRTLYYFICSAHCDIRIMTSNNVYH